MDISTREVAGKLLVDMAGPFPRDDKGRLDGADRFRDALANREDFVLVLRNVGWLTSKDIGTLFMWLKHAGIRPGGGPLVRIVCDDEHIAAVFRVAGSPFIFFVSEDEALSRGGCLGVMVVSVVGALAWLLAA